jgi:hypothetical protein
VTDKAPHGASDLVPLAERLRWFWVFRLVTLVAMPGLAWLAAADLLVSGRTLVLVAAGYLLATGLVDLLWRRAGRRMLGVFSAVLILDALFLAFVAYAAGDAQSPAAVPDGGPPGGGGAAGVVPDGAQAGAVALGAGLRHLQRPGPRTAGRRPLRRGLGGALPRARRLRGAVLARHARHRDLLGRERAGAAAPSVRPGGAGAAERRRGVRRHAGRGGRRAADQPGGHLRPRPAAGHRGTADAFGLLASRGTQGRPVGAYQEAEGSVVRRAVEGRRTLLVQGIDGRPTRGRPGCCTTPATCWWCR